MPDQSNKNINNSKSAFFRKGVIIVLGSPNDADGKLSSIALERCSQAFAEFRKNPGYSVLPTGGWGQHFNTTDKPHGFYIRQELAARGVPGSAFLPCVESSNTIEDAIFSRQLLDRCLPDIIIIVTSDFHMARARFLFEREFPETAITISGSATNLPPHELARRRNHERKALEKLGVAGKP
jgi:uncharacterized SAM-binding protein YcdF (DUF218 family)